MIILNIISASFFWIRTLKTTEKPSIITNQHAFFSIKRGRNLKKITKCLKAILSLRLRRCASPLP